MTVLVTIPVFNEERRLARCVPRLNAFLAENRSFQWRILVANNGSTDRTQAVAEQLCRDYPNLQVLWIAQKGRGGALKRSWLGSDADVLAYMDVDLATELEAFPLLVDAVASGKADLATGSRLLPGSQTCRSWWREWISRGYMRLVRALCGVALSDAQCGFKAISRAAAQALLPLVRDTGWFFDTELLVRAESGGWRVGELPVKWAEDGETRVRILSTAWGDLRGLCRLRRELRAAASLTPKARQPSKDPTHHPKNTNSA